MIPNCTVRCIIRRGAGAVDVNLDWGGGVGSQESEILRCGTLQGGGGN